MDGLLARATRLAADFDFAGSEHLLATATELAADDPRLHDARRQLAQARRGAAKLPDAHRPSQRDKEKVQALLTDAGKAQARSDWITPPGDSAWDKLRAVLPSKRQNRRGCWTRQRLDWPSSRSACAARSRAGPSLI